MDIANLETLETRALPGRVLSRVFGADALFKDEGVSMGYARFTPDKGPMPPHHHERELIYVLGARDTHVCYGADFHQMDEKCLLRAGDFLRFAEGECHIFQLTSPESYLEIIWVFGCPQNHTVDLQ